MFLIKKGYEKCVVLTWKTTLLHQLLFWHHLHSLKNHKKKHVDIQIFTVASSIKVFGIQNIMTRPAGRYSQYVLPQCRCAIKKTRGFNRTRHRWFNLQQRPNVYICRCEEAFCLMDVLDLLQKVCEESGPKKVWGFRFLNSLCVWGAWGVGVTASLNLCFMRKEVFFKPRLQKTETDLFFFFFLTVLPMTVTVHEPALASSTLHTVSIERCHCVCVCVFAQTCGRVLNDSAAFIELLKIVEQHLESLQPPPRCQVYIANNRSNNYFILDNNRGSLYNVRLLVGLQSIAAIRIPTLWRCASMEVRHCSFAQHRRRWSDTFSDYIWFLQHVAIEVEKKRV